MGRDQGRSRMRGMEELDLTPLRKATMRLREAIEAYAHEPENLLYLDSLIKRLEFTYELGRNTLLRFLELTSVKRKANEAPSLSTLIRTANQDGLLLGSWEEWHGYRDARNGTSHAYDEGKAREIAAGLPAFLQEVEFLLDRMSERLRESSSA